VPRLTFFTHHLSRTLDFARHALTRCNDLIEGVRDFAGDAGLVAWQAN
jgi:hypothetical protein